MTQNTQEGGQSLYANAVPFYIRALSVVRVQCPQGGPETSSMVRDGWIVTPRAGVFWDRH